MRDYTQAELEDGRPAESAQRCTNFCLRQLYADDQHGFTDSVVSGLTFEELIGTLLKVRDELESVAQNDVSDEYGVS